MPDIVFDITQNNIQFALEQVGRIDFSIEQPEIHFEIQGAIVSGGVSGASDFLGLTDTPDSYVGQDGKLVAVKTPASGGLEFVDKTSVGVTAHSGLTGKNSETDVKHLTDAQVSALHPKIYLDTNHGLALDSNLQRLGLGTISDCSPSATSQVSGNAHVHKVTGVATDTHTHPIVTYPASSVNAIAGSLTGTIAGVLEHDDAVVLRINETATSPGFNVEFTFTGVTSFTSLVGRGYYSGSPSHQVACEVWNVQTSAWDIFNLMSSESAYGWKAFPAYNSTHYISAGQVKIRFYHIGTGTYPGMGTVGHYLYLDYLVLQDGGGAGGGVTEHGALTGLADDDHTQYLLADGSRQLSADWNVGSRLITALGFNASPTGRLRIPSSKTGYTSPQAGDLAVDLTNKVIEFFDGTEWQSADCPVMIEPNAYTGISASPTYDLSYPVGVSKLLLKWLFVTVTDETIKYTVTLFTNSGFTQDPMQVIYQRVGSFALYLDLPYANKSGATNVYIRITKDNAVSGTFGVRLLGMKLR